MPTPKADDPGVPGEEDEIVIHSGMTPWQKAMAFFGPGLLIATVYIDPGQIVVDMESGRALEPYTGYLISLTFSLPISAQP